MIELTRWYDPPETKDQPNVSVSIEVEGTDGDRVLELSDKIETAAIDAHLEWSDSDSDSNSDESESDELDESTENEQPSGDSEVAAAKAICEHDSSYGFTESVFGDARAVAFRNADETGMTVEATRNNELTLEMPVTSDLQSLVKSARWLGANED